MELTFRVKGGISIDRAYEGDYHTWRVMEFATDMGELVTVNFEAANDDPENIKVEIE